MAKFKAGQSGNAKGRPQGITDKRTALRALFQPHAEELIGKVVELAKAGDIQALRICIDRIIPPARENRISISLPMLRDVKDCAEAQRVIIAAVATGELLPGEGEAISGLVENQRRSFETMTLEERLKAIEARIGVGPLVLR